MILKKNKAIADSKFLISKIKTPYFKIKLCKSALNHSIFSSNLMALTHSYQSNSILETKVTIK
jgi:hypothetical protein